MLRIYLKMKLFAPILVGLTSGSTDGVRQIEMTRSMFDGSRVCGMMTGSGGHMTDNMTLSEGESCIFRIKPEEKDDSTIRLTLIEAADIDCSEYQLNIVDENGVHGPYCREGRHRRGAYSASYPDGQDFMGKEVDMVYSRTAGGGFRFAFNFEFEWELLPGIPGQVQDGYAENTSYGAYGDHGGSSYGGASSGKPSYGKPSGASYGTDAKPSYGKPSGGDGDNKPAPGYAKPKPTYKPAPKPTYKPTQKPTYKPAPKPTYKPTEKPTYKPTTKYTTEKTTKYTTEATTKYTTEKTTKYTTEATTKYTTPKPYKPTKKPYTNKPYGGGGKPPLYKPVAGCPWETNHGYSSYAGDCPGHQGKCNLKYFKVCGQSFFNAVYNDVCKWQDALQLIPMVTSKLVPLGAKFERVFNTKCNGLNKEGKSLMELMGGPVEDDARDVASCKAVAGAVPCEYINFHGVTTARQFHLKVEKLYYDYLKDLCNKEWQVHFEALMVRMRGSLFCDDGSQPDHPGYTPSQAPPPYNAKPPKPTQGYTPDNTPAPYKPQKPQKPYQPPQEPQKPYQPPQPTQAPYKPPTQKPQDPYRPPQPTQKPYNPPQPTQPPYKPPTQPPQPTQPPYKPPTQPPQKPYNPPKPNKPYKPPMYKPVTNCPWEKPNGLEGDCPANPEMCNLKYFKVCGENFFNKVYNDVCHWQDAAQLIPMVTKMLVPLGARYENKNGKCNGMNYGAKSIQELMGGPVPDSERDIAQCKPVAGAVPCHYIDFSGVTSARTFHLKVEKLYHDFLKQHCNKEWQVHFEALMIRMRNSLFCPDGNSDHEGYMPSPPPPPYKPTPAPTYAPKPPPKKPYNPPKPNPDNGYGSKPVTVDGYTQYPGPMNNKGYCPWNKGAYTGSGYPKDCKKDNKCNLKFAGRCLNNLFNKVYKDICKWQEAGKLQKDINAFFVQLGHNTEKAYNTKCDYAIPQKYAGMRNNRYTDPSMDYNFEDEQFEFEFLDGENPDFADYGRRRRQASRQVPACEKWAGIIPCDLVNFHDAKNELDFYHKIVKVFGHVKKNCNDEWNKRMQSFLDRFKNSMTCPGGFPDHK